MKHNQFGRLRSQCTPDAKGLPADGVQYGRSMIEMLGVLAIIGVLSVGGIAGYSKAMELWKISRQKEQLAELFLQCVNLKDDFLR